jgi:putative nucleotidyltransferase with HDIG domain
MKSAVVIRTSWWIVESALLGASLLAVALSSPDQWRPFLLVAILAGIYLAGDRMSSVVRDGLLTPAHSAMVLAMCLLGPAPAVVFGLTAAIAKSALRRLPPSQWLANLTALGACGLVGGVIMQTVIGSVSDPHNHSAVVGATFGLLVFAISLITIFVNFAVIAIDVRIEDGSSLRRQFRDAFVPLIPGHLASAVLAALLAVAYTNLGMLVLLCGVLVLGIFHYLIGALLRSEERAEKLEARSIHLANMQLGVLSMLMDALALRDAETSRHATAVARYARALAIELDCDEEEREVVQTAALLHDIGKFTWSDRILHPEQLNDADWEVIRRHPQDGATLVGKLDGYGPVADAILYHHERVDGGGYPVGLIASEIPLASRIIAICSTFDTMTSRETNGPRMSVEDALAELRNIAGRQLDAELVERFVAMIEREGPALLEAPAAGDHATELDLAARVRKMVASERS